MTSQAQWVPVCEIKSLKSGDLFEFNHQDKKIVIVKLRDKIYATDRICTHAYADLSMGVLNEEEETLTCPLHLSAFNLNDGKPQNLPAKEPLCVYQVKLDDGWIHIFL